jgi:hypothetical protein
MNKSASKIYVGISHSYGSLCNYPSSVKSGEANSGRLVEALSRRTLIFFVTFVNQNEIPVFEPDLTEEGYSADLHFADHCQPTLSMVAHSAGTGSGDSHSLRHESIHALL